MQRATDYFDFAHVEQWKWVQNVVNQRSQLGRLISKSNRRQEYESQLRDAYEHVRKPIAVSNKNSSRRGDEWYPGTLREMARELGVENVYGAFVHVLSGCFHTSARAVYRGPQISVQFMEMYGASLAARAVETALAATGLSMSSEDQELLAALKSSPMFTMCSPTEAGHTDEPPKGEKDADAGPV